MKSLRLKRGKLNRSRKLRTRKLKSRKLKSRKLRTRKLRKGGNGNSNTKINFNKVNSLLRSISDKEYIIRELQEEEPLNIYEINQKKQQQLNAKNQVISIFENNNSFLLKLSNREKEILLNDVLNDRDISIAYAKAYLNLKDTNLIPNEAIAVVLAEHKENDDFIQEEINYKAAAAEYQVNIDFYKNYQNLKTIISIFDIPEDAVMIDKIRAVKRGEEPGPVSRNSNHLGLPGPAFETLMSIRHGENYRHQSSHPDPHPFLGADWKANSSSSSS